MVGTLQLVGNETTLASPFPDLNISPGQAFGYSKINEDREIVLNYYFNNGFPNATFEASAKPSPEQSASSWTLPTPSTKATRSLWTRCSPPA